MRGALGQSLGRFSMLLAAAAVFGLAAGWFYAKGQPRAAAGALVADFIEVIPATGNDAKPADPNAIAPTSGDHLGTPLCGVLTRDISNDDHLASLAAGIVVVRYGPSIDAAAVAEMAEFAQGRDRLLIAPEPDLDVPVVAIGWAHRMPIATVNIELLAAFHTSRVAFGPDVELESPCSP